MIQFREHRGGLEESMKTLQTFPDRDALVRHVLSSVRPYNPHVEPADVTIVPYHSVPDTRIGWAVTQMVKVADMPWGFTDLPLDADGVAVGIDEPGL